MCFRRFSFTIVLLAVAGFLLVLSCMEDLEELKNNKFELEVSPKFRVPLIDSSFTIDEFFNRVPNQFYRTTPSSGISLVYRDTIASQRGKDLFELPETISSFYDINLPNDVVLPIGETFNIPRTEDQTLVNTENGDLIDSIVFHNLHFFLRLDSPIPNDVRLLFSIPSLTRSDSNVPIAFEEIDVPQGRSELEFNFQNVNVDFTNGGVTTNTIRTLIMRGTVVSSGRPLASQVIRYAIQILDDSRMEAMYGWFGERIYRQDRDTTVVTTFNRVRRGPNSLLAFSETTLNLVIQNSFGLNATIFLDDVHVADKRGNGPVRQLALQLQGVGTDIPSRTIDYPRSIAEATKPLETNWLFNQDNSNINEMLSFMPTHIVSLFRGVLMSEPSRKDFVIDTSNYKILLDVEVPLKGRVRNIGLREPFTFDGSLLDNILAEATIVMRTTNRIPLAADIQLYFLNNAGVTIDSAFTNSREILKSAVVDASGVVTMPAVAERKQELTREQILHVRSAKQILLDVNLTTTNNGNPEVRILSTNSIEVTIGLETEVTLK